jgi:tight adherence protein B
MKPMVFAAHVAGIGVGILIVVDGLLGRPLFAPVDLDAVVARSGRTLARLGIVAAAAVFVFALTGWPVGALLAGAAAWVFPRILGGKAEREATIARTEAIASWTEMVRDSIVAASGLEEAIVATAPVAQPAIAPEVRAMVHRLDHQRLPDALIAFGNDLQIRHTDPSETSG